MKKFLAGMALAASAACMAGEEVNVYTHRHYDSDAVLFKQFEVQTGIKVNVVKAKADQLMQRLKAEGKNTPADVLMTVDVGRLYKAKQDNIFQAVKSDQLTNNIPAQFRDKDNKWFGLTKRGRVVVYHKDRVKPSELSTYKDLADSKWKGRLVVRSSSNIYNQSLVASIISNDGVAAAERWAKALVSNFARTPKGSDRDQMRAVAAGEADLAIVNTYYLGKLVHGDEKDQAVAKQLKVFFPNQNSNGTHINISGAGVVKYSKNKANAVKLIEFLSGAEAQKVFAQANYEYPVKAGVESSDLVKSWGSFKEDSADLTTIGKNNKLAVMTMDRAGWK